MSVGTRKQLNDLGHEGHNTGGEVGCGKETGRSGIFDARWSIKTHTFVTAWGEFDRTLVDVIVLTLMPTFGKAQVANFIVSEGENKKRVDTLMSF